MELDNFTRVTEVIGAFSGIDRIPKHILEKAADRGTRVHLAIEAILDGLSCSVFDEDVRPYVESWRYYERDVLADIANYTMERRLFCTDHRITGQPDLITFDGKTNRIVDWKATSKTYPHWELQAAAYKYLAQKSLNATIHEVQFVRLDACGKEPEVVVFKDLDRAEELFFKALDVYRYFKEH